MEMAMTKVTTGGAVHAISIGEDCLAALEDAMREDLLEINARGILNDENLMRTCTFDSVREEMRPMLLSSIGNVWRRNRITGSYDLGQLEEVVLRLRWPD